MRTKRIWRTESRPSLQLCFHYGCTYGTIGDGTATLKKGTPEWREWRDWSDSQRE